MQRGERLPTNQFEVADRQKVLHLSPELLAERNKAIDNIVKLEGVYARFGDGVANWDEREIELSLIKMEDE